MSSEYTIKPIAYIHNGFEEKFGIPRQSGLIDTVKSQIIFEPEYRNPDALRGLEDYSHLWLLWHFSQARQEGWSPTVRPPRLGGNTRVGVFATRSPFRPNGLGLSSVRLEGIEQSPKHGPILHVTGADLMNQTPIIDIKPYLPYVDSHPEAQEGFAGTVKDYRLTVHSTAKLDARIPEEHKAAIYAILEQDPRPSYQNDPERIYGIKYAGMNIRFRVDNGCLYICSID